MRTAAILLISQSLAIMLCVAHYAGQVAEHRIARQHAEETALRLSLELENATGQRDVLARAYLRIKRHHCGV